MAIQQKVYRSMQGKEIDMNKLLNQHEMTIAVGNVRVNARGDELGPGGQIIRKQEDVVTSSQLIPDQVNMSTSTPTNIQEQVAPVKPSNLNKKTKDVSGMDPAGKE